MAGFKKSVIKLKIIRYRDVVRALIIGAKDVENVTAIYENAVDYYLEMKFNSVVCKNENNLKYGNSYNIYKKRICQTVASKSNGKPSM